MGQVSLVIFRHLFLFFLIACGFISCGKHEQSSWSQEGVSLVSQIQAQEPLSQMIIENNIPYFENFINQGGAITSTLQSGRNLLTEACFWQRYEIVSLLIENGADIEQKDSQGKSAADYAQSDEALKRVLYPDALLDLKKKLFSAIKNKSLSELKIVLEENPPVNFLLNNDDFNDESSVTEGESLLTYCLKVKFENGVRMLATPKYELDVNMKNTLGESPLSLAQKLGLKNSEKILVKLGAVS